MAATFYRYRIAGQRVHSRPHLEYRLPSLEPVKIMVLERNDHMSQIVRAMLRGFGVRKIVDVRTCDAAFRRLKLDEIDIVIIEYEMDKMNGAEFTRLIRASTDAAIRFVPIIMLTSHTEKSRVLLARDSGISEVCAKPVTASNLFRKLVAVVDYPRPFVISESFAGPERRRRVDPTYKGPERRL